MLPRYELKRIDDRLIEKYLGPADKETDEEILEELEVIEKDLVIEDEEER